LHLVGNPKTFERADNAGVGAGITFGQAMLAKDDGARIALIPCAAGGTSMAKWGAGMRLYDDSIRRAKLALAQGPRGKVRIAGALWLQGESDSTTEERVEAYRENLNDLVDRLRVDLDLPELPFVVCTIGEFREGEARRAEINAILLDLKNQRANTGCVDARGYADHIGDRVHYDAATQEEIGRGFARELLGLKDVKK
jgi:hypothetical protein